MRNRILAMIQIQCESCGTLLKGPEHLAGKQVKCPKCKALVTLKASDTAAKAQATTAASDEAISAEDLLAEIRGKSTAGPAPASPSPAPTRIAADKAPVERRPEPVARPPAHAPMPIPERRLSIVNRVVTVVGVLAIAITIYILWQKNRASEEDTRTQKVVKDLRAELDLIRGAVAKTSGAATGENYSRAKALLEEAKEKVARVIGDIDLELGKVTTKFSKEQRDSLLEDAETAKQDIGKRLSTVAKTLEQLAEASKFIAARREEMAAIEKLIASAQQQIQKEEYVEAKRTLTKAKSAADDLIETIEEQESGAAKGELQKATESCKAEAEKLLLAIRKLLQSDEIIYGARGMVKHKGKWVTPEEKKKAEEAKEDVAIRRLWPARTPRTFDPKEMEWMIDDMSGPMQWGRQLWADDAEVSIQEANADKVLFVKYKRGNTGKVAVGRPLGMDISSRGMLVVDVENKASRPVTLCLAVQSDRFYESQGQQIKPGLNKNVTFSLSGAFYKCDKDNWQNYTFQIGSLNAVGQIIFMIYPSAEGVMVFDNVRMISK